MSFFLRKEHSGVWIDLIMGVDLNIKDLLESQEYLLKCRDLFQLL